MNSQTLTYIVLGVIAIIYALVLNTKMGKRFADNHTWASVVIGTGIVIAALWFLIPQDNWQKVIFAFVVAGAPIIARSLLNNKR